MSTKNDALELEEQSLTLKGTLKGSNSAGTTDAAITTSSTYFNGINLGILVQIGAQIYIETQQPNQTNNSVAMNGEICICESRVSDDVIKVKRGGGDGTLSTNITADPDKTLNWVEIGDPYKTRGCDLPLDWEEQQEARQQIMRKLISKKEEN